MQDGGIEVINKDRKVGRQSTRMQLRCPVLSELAQAILAEARECSSRPTTLVHPATVTHGRVRAVPDRGTTARLAGDIYRAGSRAQRCAEPAKASAQRQLNALMQVLPVLRHNPVSRHDLGPRLEWGCRNGGHLSAGGRSDARAGVELRLCARRSAGRHHQPAATDKGGVGHDG